MKETANEATHDSASVGSGEQVVQYQHHLMTRKHEPLGEEEAYRLACSKFYEGRIREEQEAEQLQLQAQRLGAQSLQSESLTDVDEVDESLVVQSEHVSQVLDSQQMDGKPGGKGNGVLDRWLDMEQAAVEQAYDIK